MKIETVSIVYQNSKVLLGMKKVRFGKGKYNGFGGSVKPNESLEECAIRETQEEAGITILKPERAGQILFHFLDSGEPNHLVHFFRATQFYGVPKETDEMIPEWFNRESIPYDKMWKDDKYWLPLLLDGKFFNGLFHFTPELEIARVELKELDKL